MKTLVQIISLLSITAIMMSNSCNKDNSKANCGCNTEFVKDLNSYDTKVMLETDSLWRLDSLDAIVYNKDSVSSCTLVNIRGKVISRSKICNCPDLITKWDFNTKKEFQVTFSGNVFESCTPHILDANRIFYDLFITNIKLKQ